MTDTKKTGANLFACHARSRDPNTDNQQQEGAPATKSLAILVGGQHYYAKCYNGDAQYELTKETDRPTINCQTAAAPGRLMSEFAFLILCLYFVRYDGGWLSR